LCLEIACHEHLADEAGPIGAWTYGISVLHCMTTSLAAGGAGLGTCGLPEPRLRALGAEAGFGRLGTVAETPTDVLYELRP
ncbi:MAG TPA: hypothetical protein VK279_06535, partial [Solirubrobacteraceae bacterium]|nr:hypothetical protein [Solirubrobacteraceae bacterium]